MSDTPPAEPSSLSPPDLPLAPEPPLGRLYRVSGIGLGTFLGSPLAGGFMLAANARRLGDPRAARRTMLAFFGATIALILLSFAALIFGDNAALTAVFRYGGLGGLIGTVAYARHAQGPRIDQHLAQGGRTESNWKAAGIGVLALIVALLLLLTIGFGLLLTGAVKMDSAGNAVQSQPPPKEITVAPGWMTTQNTTEEGFAHYSLMRFHYGMQSGSVLLQVGPRDNATLKETFDEYLDGAGDSPAPEDQPDPVEIRIDGKAALETHRTYNYDGVRVRQLLTITLSDEHFCAMVYTAREVNYDTYVREAQAMRDSLKCP